MDGISPKAAAAVEGKVGLGVGRAVEGRDKWWLAKGAKVCVRGGLEEGQGSVWGGERWGIGARGPRTAGGGSGR